MVSLSASSDHYAGAISYHAAGTTASIAKPTGKTLSISLNNSESVKSALDATIAILKAHPGGAEAAETTDRLFRPITIIIKGLDAISDIHPAVKGMLERSDLRSYRMRLIAQPLVAVTAFNAVVQIEITRRENAQRRAALLAQAADMMETLTQ